MNSTVRNVSRANKLPKPIFKRLKGNRNLFFGDSCMCDNYVLQWWVEFDNELIVYEKIQSFILFAENSQIQILLKMSQFS